MSDKWVNNIGFVRFSEKDGKKSNYLTFHKDVEIKKGHSVRLEDYSVYLDGLLKKEFINEEEHEKRSQEKIRYVMHLAPFKAFTPNKK